VQAGCVFGLLGPNGAGKTTTLRLITGILAADAGTVSVLGGEPGAARDRVGFLPEEKGLYRRMRVLDVLVYFGRIKGLAKREAIRRALAWLERLGIADRGSQRCEELSKGLGQKVQLATTLIHEPELVILDEPFSGLDPVNVEVVRNVVRDLAREGRTVLLSTHAMEHAELLCDCLLLLNHGQKVIDGATSTVRTQGARTVRISYHGSPAGLHGLPGVTAVRDYGQHAELTLAEGADAQCILQALVGRVAIDAFDSRSASLQEIFLRAVGEDPDARPPTAVSAPGAGPGE
jgi:ABC-2 type transport system ATP-binding protein